jgi:hypothetical protein
MFPSSFGMTFCVGLGTHALQITARWGHYHRDRSETLTTASGDKKIVWKRSPRETVSKPIPLKVGRLKPWKPDDEFPQVQVQGLVRKRNHFWSVTLFLVNGQEEPKKLRDTAWLFQPELIVESPDHGPVFHSRPQQKGPGKADPVAFAEEQEMAMLYRHHVEFGVGHGVSLHADCPGGVCDKAHRLSTRVVPTYEAPRTTPPTVADWPKLAGLVVDMKVMVVGGQPKTTAEYIQATSRVGRRFPGLAFTVSNGTRPRDLSHYERFEHYHATFDNHVEALSVTPFASGALSRGLTALLVSCVRLQGTAFNAHKRASRIDRNHPYVQAAIKTILRRAELVGNHGDGFIPNLQTELNERLDQWLAEAQKTAGGRVLGYDEDRDGITVGLLHRPGLETWNDFTCLNSLRDVEPNVGLIFHDGGLDADPTFVTAVGEDTEASDEGEGS